MGEPARISREKRVDNGWDGVRSGRLAGPYGVQDSSIGIAYINSVYIHSYYCGIAGHQVTCALVC